MKNYSQNNEQDFIVEFFKNKTGRFLDIGAHDGVSLSNTRALFELGWSGVLVEPHPVHFYKLWQLYGGNKSVVLVNGAVDSCNKGLSELQFNYEGPAYSSTLNPQKAVEFCANDYSKNFYVPVCGVRELIRFGPFDFISLDVEGMEIPILGNMAELCESAELMCVETCPMSRGAIVNQLIGLGFVVRSETPENLLAVRNDIPL